MTTIQIIGIIALALLGGFIFYCLYDIQRFNRSNKKKLILLALVCLTGLQAMATSRTVTYTITAEYENYNVNRWTLTFTPSNTGFGYSTDLKTVSIPNTTNTTGFTVQLDDGLSNYRSFSATFSYLQVFGQLTVTYGDPRDYTITYTNAVNGQNGVTNNNPTTYNVTTNTFQITAPSRTGYTLGTVTYTDGQHPNATPVNLIQSPMTIYRGEAATRKAITFNASWTPNTYTVTLDNQSATTPGTESVTATYNAAMPAITIPTKTGYTFGGYYTATNGGGTQYYNADGSSAHNWDIASATTLYALWIDYTHTYTVHFNANATNGINATGTMSNQSFTYDQGVLYANAFTRTGYTFVNWNTQADGGGTTYTNQQASPNITPDDGATVTLYAQWSVTPWTGSGDSEQDPYLILYASQLVKISNDVNGGNQYSGTYFKLGNDIDMDGVAFDGIGNGSGFNQFYGNFNGDNKVISHVTINKPTENYVGFFSQPNYGTIKNLILDWASITGQSYVGVIAVYPASIANNHYRNCTVTKDGSTYTTNIGTDNGDIAGARSIHTLTLPEHFTATSAETVTYNQVTYYASNVEVTLTLEQGCYITDDVTVNGTPATENGNGTWTFIMPAADATVSATVMEYKITVNEGTDVNYNVPFSSQYCDRGAHSQFIIPAADLDSIQWGAIHKMTFFSNTASVSWENVEYDVYFAEVNFTTFGDDDWINISDYTNNPVYRGGVSVSDSTMEITLSSPFPYYGGNLLVYFYENNNTEYNGPEMKWYGKTQTDSTAVYQLGSDGYQVQFLPKITFGYIPAPSCIPPTALTVGEVTNHTAAISWTANSNETAWHVYYSTNPTAPADDISLSQVIVVDTNPEYTFENLAASTKYYFWVRGNCGNGDYSSWSGSNFTTEIACAAPTRLNVSNIASTSATLSWTSDGDDFDVTYAELPDASSEYKYDNGVYENCIPNRYAGVLLPAGSYTESNVRKISVYDSYMAAGAVCQLWICYGTSAPDMENALYTDYVIYTGTNAIIDIPIDVAVDKTKNLWVVMHSDGDKFSLPACNDHSSGEATANGRWYSEDGSAWSNNDY